MLVLRCGNSTVWVTILQTGSVKWSKRTDTLSHPSSNVAFLCLLPCITPAVSSDTNEWISLAEGLISFPHQRWGSRERNEQVRAKQGMELLKLAFHQQNPHVKPGSQGWWVAALISSVLFFSGRDSAGGRHFWRGGSWVERLYICASNGALNWLWFLRDRPTAWNICFATWTTHLYSPPLKNKNKWTDWEVEHKRMDKEGMLMSSCSRNWESKQSFQSTSQEV